MVPSNWLRRWKISFNFRVIHFLFRSVLKGDVGPVNECRSKIFSRMEKSNGGVPLKSNTGLSGIFRKFCNISEPSYAKSLSNQYNGYWKSYIRLNFLFLANIQLCFSPNKKFSDSKFETKIFIAMNETPKLCSIYAKPMSLMLPIALKSSHCLDWSMTMTHVLRTISHKNQQWIITMTLFELSAVPGFIGHCAS